MKGVFLIESFKKLLEKEIVNKVDFENNEIIIILANGSKAKISFKKEGL